ncbi:MAG: hypothetical protein JG766_1925 [Desulfacinum sp.]|jgi:hypothetical protein|nr:hypothetical protein [Desulfacinum sp.]
MSNGTILFRGAVLANGHEVRSYRNALASWVGAGVIHARRWHGSRETRWKNRLVQADVRRG